MNTKVLVTGSDGFIGRNLRLRLSERSGVEVLCFSRASDPAALPGLVAQADFVFHLAGINRPRAAVEFEGNVDSTASLLAAVAATGRRIPIVYTSSTQATRDNPYGQSKVRAEQLLENSGNPVYIFRLPNVFGKWCKPNYNSAVATFCHNIANGLPIEINDPSVLLTLAHVDDVISAFFRILDTKPAATGFIEMEPQYQITVGEVAQRIRGFHADRTKLMVDDVGTGLTRALYATYVSYLPVEQFCYAVQKYADPRGVFVEMLKTKDAGQFSFFTAHPGITRGGHYHHAKTEKFLVIQGQARFRFRHVLTDAFHEVVTSGAEPTVVETIPGWTHDVTNVGQNEMICMLWANEVFDRERPDTVVRPV